VLRKIFLPSIFIILSYGFWISPDFKEIAAGVAIFLFGMLSLEQGFKAFTGGALEKLLKRFTSSKVKSIGFGVLTTTVMQSSSLVSVITISFLSAGLLGLSEGIGIIFGANLGTTTGAWLVAGLGLKVKISAYAMPMLVFGIVLIFQKNNSLKGMGYILAGLGFLFLGIHYMKEGFETFKSSINLAEYAMSGYLGLFVFAAIGIAATVIMQSSHATLVLIITALSAQQISYENALALAIGANVGTTITAIIGAMSASVEGKRLAGAHLIFNLVTGLIAIIFIQQFLMAVDTISAWVGIANNDYTLKLAVFHTLFNLAGVLLMIPLINKLVIWLERYFKEPKSPVLGAKYLHSASIDFPETAVEAIRKETVNIYELASELIFKGLSVDKKDALGQESIEQVLQHSTKPSHINLDLEYEHKIKGIYSEIIEFISKASFTWEVEQSASIHWLRSANKDIVEAIKDLKHLHKNLTKYINSDNYYIKQEYDFLREQIILVMRELEKMRQPDIEEDTLVLSFDALKLTLKENENRFNNNLIKLLQKGHILPTRVTSLMNDASYTFSITSNLIEMAKTLFVNYDEMQIKVEREVALDAMEIAELAADKQSTKDA